MRARLSIIALTASCLGLGASLASLVDYVGADASFCDTSGCSTVRLSAWARPFGIPMPVFGVAFFALMVALSFASRPRFRMLTSFGGALWAVALIGVQAFVLNAWCKLCLVSDVSAIAAGVAIAAGATTVAMRGRVVALMGSALSIVPIVFLALAPPPSAEPVLATTKVDAQGKVNIIEFVDFECPYCRRLAPILEKAIAEANVPVNVVRKMVPLKMHPHAMTAALAWCCADAQGKGDEMAAALFATDPDELTPENCERVATSVGCDLEVYRTSLADPATAKRVETDLAEASAAGVHALPTIFIGDQHLTGANHDVPELVAAIERSR
ncbi:MAG TPA: vitamin K epoxide reductase family protein [Kofleriaceae bacterium]